LTGFDGFFVGFFECREQADIAFAADDFKNQLRLNDRRFN
jgi:hypothetical protein